MNDRPTETDLARAIEATGTGALTPDIRTLDRVKRLMSITDSVAQVSLAVELFGRNASVAIAVAMELKG